MLIYDKMSNKYGRVICEANFEEKPSTLILKAQGEKYIFTRDGVSKSGSPFDKEMLSWCDRNSDRIFEILIEWEKGNDEAELIDDNII